MGLLTKISETVKKDIGEAMASLAHEADMGKFIKIYINDKFPESASRPGSSTILESTVDVRTTVLSSVNKVEHDVTVMFQFLVMYGLEWDEDISASIRDTFYYWIYLDLHQELEVLIKFVSAHWFAHLSKQEVYGLMPKKPDWIANPNRCLIGKLHNFMIRISHTNKRYSFCWTFLNLKRGCAPLDFPKVAESVRKHRSIMTDLSEGSEETLAYITKCTRTFFKVHKKSLKKDFRVPTPSLNAGFDRNSSKPKGGNRNLIRLQLSELVEEYCQEHGYEMPMNGLLPNMDSVTVLKGKGNVVLVNPETWEQEVIDCLPTMEYIVYDWSNKSNFIIPKYTERSDDDSSSRAMIDNLSMISDESKFNIIQKHVVSLLGPANCGVVALKEPFKVRIITKSDSLINYYGIPLQKMLFGILSNIGCTQLIGKPLSLEIIQKYYSKFPQHHLLVSGDYSSATDMIFRNCSVQVLNTIIDMMDVSNDVREVLLKTLQGQRLHYDKTLSQFMDDPWVPACINKTATKKFNRRQEELLFRANQPRAEDLIASGGSFQIHYDTYLSLRESERINFENNLKKYAVDPSDCVQTRGQLMGSILSFPILCLLNIFMFKLSFEKWNLTLCEEERYNGRITFDYLHGRFGLLVNGDDISFHAPKDLIDIWDNTYGNVGLTQSVGKNYKHPNLITINSRLYVCRRIDINTVHWKEEKMLNLGLLFAGSKYVQELDDMRKANLFKSYGQIQSDLLMINDTISKRIENTGKEDENIFYDNLYCQFMRDETKVLWTPDRVLLNDFFLYNNKETLSELSGPLNWFLPHWAGGVGLTTPDNIQLTTAQKLYLVYILTRSTPEQIFDAKFKYLSVLPSMTEKSLKVLKEFINELSPAVKFERDPSQTEEWADLLQQDLLNMNPFENTLSEKTLKKIEDFGPQELKTLKTRIWNIFRQTVSKIFFGRDLTPPNPKTIEHVKNNVHAQPVLKLEEEFTTITSQGMASYTRI